MARGDMNRWRQALLAVLALAVAAVVIIRLTATDSEIVGAQQRLATVCDASGIHEGGLGLIVDLAQPGAEECLAEIRAVASDLRFSPVDTDRAMELTDDVLIESEGRRFLLFSGPLVPPEEIAPEHADLDAAVVQIVSCKPHPLATGPGFGWRQFLDRLWWSPCDRW